MFVQKGLCRSKVGILLHRVGPESCPDMEVPHCTLDAMLGQEFPDFHCCLAFSNLGNIDA
jgi:hypothetical protein